MVPIFVSICLTVLRKCCCDDLIINILKLSNSSQRLLGSKELWWVYWNRSKWCLSSTSKDETFPTLVSVVLIDFVVIAWTWYFSLLEGNDWPFLKKRFYQMKYTLRFLITESFPSLRERTWEVEDSNHTERSIHMPALLKNLLVLGWNHGLDLWTELLIIS